MARRTSGAELEVIIEKLIEEARSDSGTWSLKTYTVLRKDVERFDVESAAQCVDCIVTALRCETKPTTRYKLAQLCTILRSLRPPLFEDIFQKHQEEVESTYKEISEAELGHSTVKLLKSLFQELTRRRGSSGLTAPSVIREAKGYGQLYSKTPDPDPNELAYLRNQGCRNASSHPALF